MKKNLATKIFTVTFCLLLVVLMVFAFIYVAAMDDFVPPNADSEDDSGETVDDNVWNYDMDDLLDYLDEKGIIDKDSKIPMSDIGTENWIANGIDLIWWDVENLVEGTVAYDYWNELQENDNIYIMYCGTVYAFTAVNGPFAIWVNQTVCTFSAEEVAEVFNAFPSAWSGAVTSAPSVWDYNMDDFLDYFEEKGVINKSNLALLATVGTLNYKVNGIDIIWWDVENLVEGTEPYDYWNEMQENDCIYIMYGGAVYAFTAVNGPFAIWVDQTQCPIPVEDVVKIFKDFPSAWSGAEK